MVRPFEGLVFLFLLGSLSAIVVFVETQMIGVGSLGASIMLERDPRFVRAGRYPIGIVRRWILLLALPLAAVYVVGWILDEVFNGDIRVTTVGVLVVALILAAAAFCCCGRRPQIFGGNAVIEEDIPPGDDDSLGTTKSEANTGATKRRIGVTLKNK